MRQLGQAVAPRPLHYFGFDLDMVPGGTYEDVPADLAKYGSLPAVAKFLKILKPVAGESSDQELARLASARELWAFNKEALIRKIGSVPYAKTEISVTALSESLRFMLIAQSKPCDKNQHSEWYKKLMQAMAERERAMFKILQMELDTMGPDAKIVLMGHDMHLSKDPESLHFTKVEVPEKYAAPMWPSIGEYVSQTLALPTYSIWLIHATGTQSNLDCATSDCPVESGPDYLGKQLAIGGPLFLLPLTNAKDPRAKIFQRPVNFSVNGGTHSGEVGKNADLIFFIEKVSGMRKRN